MGLGRPLLVRGRRPAPLILHKGCDGEVSDRGICERCGEVLHARDAYQAPGPGWDAALTGLLPAAGETD